MLVLFHIILVHVSLLPFLCLVSFATDGGAFPRRFESRLDFPHQLFSAPPSFLLYLGCRFAYLFCPLGVYSSSHAPLPLANAFPISQLSNQPLLYKMNSLANGYISDGNAKCRLGSRSAMRISASRTPLHSPMFTRPYIERHLE
jgi:hypothetical protein